MDSIFYFNRTPLVFFFVSNNKILTEKWSNVSSAISAIYQSDMSTENDFEKWNLYLIYVCSEFVSKNLKSKIEHDKFSSRKIVEFTENDFTDELANKLIIKHITSTDLIEIVNKTTKNDEDNYIPKHTFLWNLIPKDDSLNRKTDLQDKILQQLEMMEINEN